MTDRPSAAPPVIQPGAFPAHEVYSGAVNTSWLEDTPLALAELDYSDPAIRADVADANAGSTFVSRRQVRVVLQSVTVLAANRIFRQWFETPRTEGPIPLKEVLNGFTISTNLALTQQLVRVSSGDLVRGDIVYLKPLKGSTRVVRLSLLPFAEGRRCMMTLNDVTGQVTAELARAENDLVVRAMLHGIQESLAVIDTQRNTIALASPDLARWLGYEHEELIGMPWPRLLAPDSPGTDAVTTAGKTGFVQAPVTLRNFQGVSIQAEAAFSRVLLPMPRDMVRVRLSPLRVGSRSDPQQVATPQDRRVRDRQLQLQRANELVLLHQRRARMLRDLAVAAHRSSTVDELLAAALPVLKLLGGWPLVRVIGNSGREFIDLGLWHGDDSDGGKAVRSALQSSSIPLESPLAQRVLQNRSPSWRRSHDTNADDPEPVRRFIANGGRGWVPIAVDGKVDYVVELMGTATHPMSVHTLRALSEASAQLAMAIGRLRAETSLRLHEHQMRAIFEHAPVASLHLDTDGKVLRFNRAAARMLPLGRDAPDPESRLLDFVTDEDKEMATRLLSDAVDNHRAGIAELRLRSRFNREIVAQTSVSVILSDDEQIRQLVVVLDDITVLKNAEFELRLSESRFRTVFEHALHGIGTFRPDGTVNELNRRFQELLGSPNSDGDGSNLAVSRFLGHRGSEVWQRALDSAAAGTAERFELNVVDSQARERILDMTLSPVADQNGKALLLVGSATDITDVRQAVREREELLRGMSERMHELQCLYAVAVSAQEGGSTGDMLERASKVMGRKWPAAKSGRLRITYRDLQLDVGTDGVERSPRDTLKKNKVPLTVDLISDSERTNSEFQTAIFRILHLAAQRQATEEELRSAREAAEVASRAKSAFLAHVSHEIRTPMNAILGFAQLLSRDDLTTHQRGRVERILRAGDHLTSLLNAVLEISKIESGRVTLEPEVFELPRLLEDVEAMFSARAVDKGLEYGFNFSELPSAVRSDAGKLRQIFINLVGNAIKFTDDGFVRVDVSNTVSEGGVTLEFQVSDSGPGIGENDLERIFERFESSHEWTKMGTGLGLAICKEYAELLGGDISVSSTHGTGSVFRVGIPLELVDAIPSERRVLSETPRALKRVRTLVVDDNADNREVLTEQMQALGLRVDQASGGLEALKMSEEVHYHLVMMDLAMPDLDGIETTRRLRARPDMVDAKIIAVSAHAFNQDRRRALDAGADAFLGKPFTPEQLEAVLASIVGDKPMTLRRTAPPRGIANVPEEPQSLKPEVLPEDFAVACIAAALEADLGTLETLAEALEATAPRAKTRLVKLIEAFDYDGVVALAEQWRQDAATTDAHAPKEDTHA